MAGRDISVSLALAFIRFRSWLPGYAVPLWENAVLMYLRVASPLQLGV